MKLLRAKIELLYHYINSSDFFSAKIEGVRLRSDGGAIYRPHFSSTVLQCDNPTCSRQVRAAGRVDTVQTNAVRYYEQC